MDAWIRDEMVRLIPKLRAHAFVLTRSSAEADDVVQETLARAWRFRATFRPGSNIKAWLFRILRNVYLAGLAHPPLVADPEGRFTRDLRTEPDQEWRLQFGELMEALAVLNEPTRQALLLVVGSGFTYEEAAVACGCSVGTVKSRVSRGRERLARLIGDEAEPAPAEAPAASGAAAPGQHKLPPSASPRARLPQAV
jgi:RNA polymerase sigma-70 factor (ECF subfamily)